ncbi:MAG: SDR family NAD(P)-dependent oxidoreductase [bacterium]
MAELWRLDGRVAVVAGGGGGIGRAIVARLQEAGAEVVSADRPGVPAPPGATSFEGDLADESDAARLFETVAQRWGRLDVVVHAAGITRDAVLWKLEPAAWRDVLRSNLDSAFLLLREAIPRLRATGGGSIALVSSINGERGKFGQANYSASKAGMNALARTAAREAGAFGVRVNVVAPGFIETEMTRGLPTEVRHRAAEETLLKRTGQPDDVARAVLFLVTDAGRHVTGQVLRVDGGQLVG